MLKELRFSFSNASGDDCYVARASSPTLEEALMSAAKHVLKRAASVLGPLMLAAFPLLSLFAQNQADLELSVLWWPLAFCLGGAAVVYAGFLLLTRNSAKAGVAAALVLFAFFYYGLLADQRPWWVLALWLAVFAVAVVVVVRTKRELVPVMVILTVGAAAMALPQAFSVVRYHANHPSYSATDPALWPSALPKPSPPAGTKLPDIYVLVPDDYPRYDVLKEYFKFDDAHFRTELRKRGFVIDDQATAPYGDSEMNTAALLNMDYVSKFPDLLGKESIDVRPVKRVEEDNRAARLLESIGYDYVHMDTDEVTYAFDNPDVSVLSTPDSFSNLWMQQSVLHSFGGPFGFNQEAGDRRYRDAIQSVFSDLDRVPQRPGPKFVFFHTLLPHDPYVYDANGKPVTFPGKAEEDLSSPLGRKYFRAQVEYVGKWLLDTVDQIQANSKTPPVILIHSDEGFSAEPDEFGEEAVQNIRVKGLAAFYLPGVAKPWLPASHSSVNALRLVFNKYLGTKYEMLRSASYPELDFPYQFEEMKVK
jgi:hypothetical protein